MFEKQDTGAVAMSTILDIEQHPENDKFLNPEIKNIFERQGRKIYFETRNTYAYSNDIIERPDLKANLNLLQELTGTATYIRYVMTNLLSNMPETIQNNAQDKEFLQNLSPTDIVNALERTLNFVQYDEKYTGDIGTENHITFHHVKRGASLITSLKNMDLEKINEDDRTKAILTLKRRKDIELSLINSRYDNFLVFETILKRTTHPRRCIHVIYNNHTWAKIRVLISQMITKLFPENLNLDSVQDTDALEKVKALFAAYGKTHNDNTEWLKCLEDILFDPTRTDKILEKSINSLILQTKEERTRVVKRRIASAKSVIEDLDMQIEQKYADIRQDEMVLLTMQEDPELKTKLQELIDYSRASKLISSITVTPEEKAINITIDAPIRYYDQEFAKALIGRMSTSSRYRGHDGECFKELIKDLFVDEKITLLTTTDVEIGLYKHEHTLPADSTVKRRNSSQLKYIGQPHLNNYNCLGGNKTTVSKAGKELDLLGIITVYTTAAQNFNLTDSAVFNTFRDDVLGDSTTANKKSFRDNETGKEFSFNEYFNNFLARREELKRLEEELKRQKLEEEKKKAEEMKNKYDLENVSKEELQNMISYLRENGTTLTVLPELLISLIETIK